MIAISYLTSVCYVMEGSQWESAGESYGKTQEQRWGDADGDTVNPAK